MVTSESVNNLKNFIGCSIIIHSNRFRYEGEVKSVDDTFIQIYDIKRNKGKFIRIDTITDMDV